MENLMKLLEHAKGYIYGEEEVKKARRIIKYYPYMQKDWENLDNDCSKHPHSKDEIQDFCKRVKECGNVYVFIGKYTCKENIYQLENPDIDFRMFDRGRTPVISITL